jgi:hypothetical protein
MMSRDTRSPASFLTDLPTRMASPKAAVAAADVMVAACQRSFTLQAELMDRMVEHVLEQSRRTVADPGSALSILPSAWLQPTATEPLWRYAAGMMAVCQNATASLVTIATAQVRGADDEIDMLTRDAHEDLSRSAVTAAEAAGTTMNNGLAAFGRLGELAATAGNAVNAEFQHAQAQASRTAEHTAAAAASGRGARPASRSRAH